MAKLDILIKAARKSCEFRGHDMAKFRHGTTQAVSNCHKCGRYVMVDTKPPANGIDIGGEAVALNCEVQ